MATQLKTDFSNVDGVKLPDQLRKIPPKLVEDYVQARLNQLVVCLCQELSQHDQPSGEVIKSLSQQIMKALPGVSAQAAPLAQRDLSLRFTHDCSALGCLDYNCRLCMNNPIRKCESIFSSKYCVRDNIKAACGSNVRIELVDTVTGELVKENVPNIKLEVVVLDGLQYKSRFLENGDLVAGTASYNAELEKCALYFDNKLQSQPLLTAQSGNSSGANDQHGKLVLSMQGGRAELVDVIVVRSSEALLSGRKPPFRLLAKAKDGTELKIKPVVSEPFVVNTRRARNDGKAGVPLMNDDVGKLDHMGRETVKKLQDLRAAAQSAGEKLDIPDIKVQTVSDFRQLALKADQDGTLKAKLLHTLKLSKDKWEEAKEHAMKAVDMDNSMRGWTTKNTQTCVKLLFRCRHGVPDLSMPAAYTEKGVMSYPGSWRDDTREVLRRLAAKAQADWHKTGHPHWEITELDSDLFVNGDGESSVNAMYDGSMRTVATTTLPIITMGHGVMGNPRPMALAGQGSAMAGQPQGQAALQGAASETSNQMSGVSGLDGLPAYGAAGGMPRMRRDSQSEAMSKGKRGRPAGEVYGGPNSMTTAEYPTNPASPYDPSPTSRYGADVTPFMQARDTIHSSLVPLQPTAALYPMTSATPPGNKQHREVPSPRDYNNNTNNNNNNNMMGAAGMSPMQPLPKSPAALSPGKPQMRPNEHMHQQYGWDGTSSLPPNALPPSTMPMAHNGPNHALSPCHDPTLQNNLSSKGSDWSSGRVSGNGAHIPNSTVHRPQQEQYNNTQEGVPNELYIKQRLMAQRGLTATNGHQEDSKAWNNHHTPPTSQPVTYNTLTAPNGCGPTPQAMAGTFPFSVPNTWANAQNLYPLPQTYHANNAQLPISLPITATPPCGPDNLSCPMTISQIMESMQGRSLPAHVQAMPSLLVPSMNLQAPSFELVDVDQLPIDPSQLDPAMMQQLMNTMPIPSCEMGESLGLLHSLVLEDEGEGEDHDGNQPQQQG